MKDSSVQSSSLLTSSVNSSSSCDGPYPLPHRSLSSALSMDSQVQLLLILCFVIPPSTGNQTGWRYGVHVIWYYVCSVIIAIAAMAVLVTTVFITINSVSTLGIVVMSFNVICYCLQFLSCGIAIHYAVHRLKDPVEPVDLGYFGFAANQCFRFIAMFVLITIVGAIILSESSVFAGYSILILFIEWVGLVSVVISLLFTLVDARVCAAIVDDMTSLADKQTLTLKQLEMYKAIIDGRVNRSMLITGVLVVISALHGATFIMGTFCLRYVAVYGGIPGVRTMDFVIGDGLLYVSLYLKEMVYLALVVFEAARVNDSADRLFQKLCKSAWKDDTDAERMRLFIACYNDPVSYSILGVRVTKMGLYLQVAGYVLGVVVSVLEMALGPEMAKAEKIDKLD